KSNRETGDGRSDLMLYQQDRFINAVIIEFKVCRDNEEVDAAAERALRQINDMDYAAEAREQGYKNILKYGVAFKRKVCCAVVEKE
ncbi:MAG: PD-(D/E)XK nuclease domain-containing protein, partial [Clostridia bacterium]|nr:PD-(D/E)XK nuclease domain-containing protein [Clostridia bacterium]